MRRVLRSLASRCLDAGRSSQAQLPGVEAVASSSSSTHGLFAGSRSLSVATASAPLASTSTAAAGSLSGAPRSCWWMMQLAQAQRHCPAPLDLSAGARHYAKAAKGGGGGGGGGAATAGPKKRRTGNSKLYSCRNDRLRHTHEQIWPTLKLTEPELVMFKRNSRMFVVDMNRYISVEDKLRMGTQKPDVVAEAAEAAKAGASSSQVAAITAPAHKLPYHHARPLMYEGAMHLEATGENPRYLRVRRLGSMYATKLQNVRKLRLLLGFQRRGFVQRMYENTLITPGPHRMWKMVSAMESHLPVFATRMGMAEDVVGAVSAIRHGKVHVNGRRPDMPWAGYLAPGDVVGPAAGSMAQFKNRVAKSLQALEGDVIRGIM